ANQTDAMFLKSNGNLGINVSDPQARLHVGGSMIASSIKVTAPASAGVAVINDQGELVCSWPLGSYPSGPIDTTVSIAQLATLGNINPGFFIEDRLGTMNLDIATLYADKQDTI